MAVQDDRFDTLDDEALARYLAGEAEHRREHLVIEQRGGEWIAETWAEGGLSSGRSVMLGAGGSDRRAAMLGLARKFDANRF